MLTFTKATFQAVFVIWPTFPTNWERNKVSTRKPTHLETTRKPPSISRRMKEHLKENGLKLEATDYIVGRTLEFDSKTESIKGDDEANALLTRDYRAPFVVPEKV